MNLRHYLTSLLGMAPKILRRLAFTAVAVAVLSGILGILVIDAEPWVWHKPASSQHYMAVTRNILHSTTSPMGHTNDKVRNIALTEEDLTAISNFVLARKKLEGSAQANIFDRRLVLLMSIKIPVKFASYYLNLKLIADDAEPKAYVKQVKAGFIALPKPLVRVLLWWFMHTTRLGRYLELTLPLLQEVRIGDGRFRVALHWDREVMGEVQELVADLADKERLRVYYAKLAELIDQSQSHRFIGLSTLIRPLAMLAKERSEAEGGDAREENRAWILMLAAYANGKNLGSAIYPDTVPPTLASREVLLNRRIDAAQHFTASAVLAISGHRAFADMVGLAKEFNDTHGGSGFSFIDLAADRAGALFGKMAVTSNESARRVQAILGKNSEESIFMPNINDLPENLSYEDFIKRFGDIDTPEFQQLKNTIEDRIATCALYH